MVALDRQTAWLEALTQPAVAAVGDAVETAVDDGKPDPDFIGLRAAHAEIAAAVRVSDCVAADKLHVARTLTTELSAVQQALTDGEISIWHARAIIDCTDSLSRGTRHGSSPTGSCPGPASRRSPNYAGR